jgi:anthranilate/para-aminobenzoate synthase component II
MTKQNKVNIVGPDPLTMNMFLMAGWGIVHNPADADLIQFTGGSDVSPALYGAAKHATTWSDARRDAVESDIFYKNRDIPMAGICRGGQFLNVMHGGSMWQDINNHGRNHKILFEDGKEYAMTSTHHQMMRPSEAGRIVGTTSLSSYRETETERNTDKDFRDVEIVLYPGALCYQPHPEYVQHGHDCHDLYFDLLKQHLGL